MTHRVRSDSTPVAHGSGGSPIARVGIAGADLTKAERLARTFALSAFVRDLAWAGAMRHAAGRGPHAVRERFLEQLYGHDASAALRRLTARL